MTAFLFSTIFMAGGLASAQQILGAEALMGHMVTPDGIHIQVRSGGCTSKRNFKVQKETRGPNQHVLTFVRTEIDPCLAFFAYGKVLTYSFEELGLQDEDHVEIVNPDIGVTIYH